MAVTWQPNLAVAPVYTMTNLNFQKRALGARHCKAIRKTPPPVEARRTMVGDVRRALLPRRQTLLVSSIPDKLFDITSKLRDPLRLPWYQSSARRKPICYQMAFQVASYEELESKNPVHKKKRYPTSVTVA
ncbi:hypothetical protein V6N11_033817 [Hibiscus sabdariffa]|uniref:Uncharacterized protein n=1 Tax=Hibiscus sabdariffa TaxID=183260 RepID=A0ABR2S0Z0_9ROSI